MTRSKRNNTTHDSRKSGIFETADRSAECDPRRIGGGAPAGPRRILRVREPIAYIRWCAIGQVVAAVSTTFKAVGWFVRVFTRGRLSG